MKPHPVTPHIIKGPLPRPIRKNTHSSKKEVADIPHHDEETLQRLNAIVKEYPFCIYYKEKKNDPL